MTGIRIVPSEGDQAKFISRTSDPTSSDYGYPVSTIWVNTSTSKVWIHAGSGTWVQIGGSGSSGSWGEYSATISGGAITVTNPGIYCLTPEGGIADNLDTINGGNIGDEIIIYPVDSTNTITVRHNQDNIQIGYNFSLDHIYDQLRLTKRTGNIWVGGGLNDNS